MKLADMEKTSLLAKGKKGIFSQGTKVISDMLGHLQDYPRLPFDVFSVDCAMAGGLPMNVPVQFFGMPEGGKTTLAYLAARSLSRYCIKCLRPRALCTCKNFKQGKLMLIHSEGLPPEKRWFDILNYDIDNNSYIALPDIGEEGFDTAEGAISSDDCGLVIIDSIAGLRPKVELEAAYLESTVGRHAQLVSRFFYRLSARLTREMMRGHYVGLICINQMRARIGARASNYEAKESAPGAFCAKHGYRMSLKSTQLSLKTDSDERDADTGAKNMLKFSVSMIGESTKQQIFTLAGKAEWRLALSDWKGYGRGQVIDTKTLREAAEATELLVKVDKGGYVFGGMYPFRILGDFENALKIGFYTFVDDDGKENTIEHIDTIVRYMVMQKVKKQAMESLFKEEGRKVLPMTSVAPKLAALPQRVKSKVMVKLPRVK